ncbi:MAG: trypsin-like serine protease [Burkholderiales bacterium]|nr:trypsin-like serine protease [Burkholderiales bacterium]
MLKRHFPSLFGNVFILALLAAASTARAIGGGAIFSAEHLPHSTLVAIEVVRDGRSAPCTGFLLNATTVVTAARCFGAFMARPATSIALVRSRTPDTDRSFRIPVSPDQVLLHPAYVSRKGPLRDWAVIKLRQPFPGHESIHYSFLLEDTRADHYGLYGYGSDETGRPGVLRKLFPQGKDLDPAAETADYFYFNHPPGVGLCAGDFGGPVLVAYNGRNYVVGASSPEIPDGAGVCPGRSRVAKIAPVAGWLRELMAAERLPDDAKAEGGGGKP